MDTYHDYGKLVIWDALDDLVKKSNYKYYHFTSEYDGTRDKSGHWIHVDNFFSDYPTEFLSEPDLLFVVLYNSEISSDPKYNWVNNCSKSRLLTGKEWLCSLYRKAIGYQYKTV